MQGQIARDGNYSSLPITTKVPAVLKGQRRALNLIAMLQNLLAPWLLFCTLSAMISFSPHFTTPQFVYAYGGFCLLLVALCGFKAFLVMRRKRLGMGVEDPTWWVFLTCAMALALVLAVIVGQANYNGNMHPFYDIANLNMYPYVDIETVKGQQAMDAGRVYFAPNAVLDLKRSTGLKNKDVYCVAPITIAGKPLVTYDYWAVGKNCCSGNGADFRCGQYDNPKARAGLRLMKDDERPFYRLAVQQAEAQYQIRATHPLFFHWTQDPNVETQGFQDEGMKLYMLGMFGHFGLSLLLVALASYAFRKMGYY